VDGDDDRESTRVYRRGCEGNVQKKIGEGIYSPTGVDDYFRNKFINPAPHPDDYFRSGGGLTVSRSIDRGESYPGGLVTYTLTVRNLSRISIHNIVATVTFQNGGQISIEDPGGGSVQHPSLRWNVGTLVPGGEKRIRYRARMGSHLRHGHQVHNSAYITASNAPSVTTGTVVDIVQLMPQTGLGGLSESFGKTRDLLKPIPSITTDTSGNGTVFVWFVISLTGIGLGGLLSKKMFL